MKAVLYLLLICFPAFLFAQQDVMINEIYFSENEGWIELYNAGNETQTFENLYVSDDQDKLDKWKVSQQNIKILPKSFYVVLIGEQQKFPHIKTNKIEKDLVIVSKETAKSSFITLDQFFLIRKNKVVSKCRFPDGVNRFFRTPRPTMGKTNEIRNFIMFHASVKQSVGISSAAYRQVKHETKSSPLLFNGSQLGWDIYLWERYKAPFYIGVSTFRHSFNSNFYDTTAGGYIRDFSTEGKEITNWVDITLPVLYNEVRVTDKIFVDFGFVFSFQYKDKTNYIEKREVTDLTGKSYPEFSNEFKYNSQEQVYTQFKVRMPFKLGIQYEVFNDGFVTFNYLLRNTPNDPTYDVRRDSRYTFNVGFSYTPSIFKIKSF